MSRLRVFHEQQPSTPLRTVTEPDAIRAELAAVGVRFEQWQASQPVAAGASQDAVLAAYRADVDRLVAAHGFRTVDVVSLTPDHPQREAMRQKFLEEHVHHEDEVRFFVDGSGLFTLHPAELVYELECTKGDLVSVPDRMRHWFDMGPHPHFVAIRFFQQPDGWVGHFTGSDLAQRFPRYEPGQAA
ncbi:MAG: hypothetical protein RL653_2498 [Pseudomonadota bacterium]|jgi:1,2-dihydroxy-3-keto-5-methylthiopentene dioxygenase